MTPEEPGMIGDVARLKKVTILNVLEGCKKEIDHRTSFATEKKRKKGMK